MKTMKPRQAVAYVRVSTDKQADVGVSLDNQERACQEWALRNGVLIVKLFREEGASGKTMKRPKMIEMLDYLDENYKEIDFVIVYQLDRLGRNMMDFVDFTRQLIGYKVELRDSSSQMVAGDSDDLIQGVQMLLAQHDNQLKSKRVRENMRRHASDGYRMHKAPYGLRNIRDDFGHPTVEPVPVIADNIAYLLTEYAKGVINKAQILHKAREMGLKQMNGKEMTPQFIYKMLHQPLYAGLEKSSLTDSQLIPSVFEGIVPEWVYYTNQQLLASRKRNHTEGYKMVSAEYVLRKFTICEDCGKPIRGSAPTGQSGKRYPRYHCSTRGCHSAYVKPDDLHEQFLSVLDDIRPDEDKLKFLKTMILRVWHDEVKTMRLRRKKIREHIDKVGEEKIDAAQSVVSGDITSEEKAAITNRLKQKSSKLTAEAQKLDRLIGTREEAIDYAVSYMGNVPKLWGNASPEMKVQFQRMIFPDGITYNLRTHIFGTPHLSHLYTLANIKKDPSKADESLLVTSRRIELRLPG